MHCLHLLLKVSNHISLLRPAEPSTRHISDTEIETIRSAMGPEHYQQLLDDHPDVCAPEHCGKIRVLQALLAKCKSEGSKVLLFSSSVRMLNILHQWLTRTKSYQMCRYDGSMTTVQRNEAVRRFMTEPSLFLMLISTGAGGLGLNLQAANVVIIFEPNWDPSADQQVSISHSHTDTHTCTLSLSLSLSLSVCLCVCLALSDAAPV
eukprot:TRINITY_DN1673_c0_g1_i1.p1 TRINITY_DN1673_c0_g1~~TRINITY_DN1673_c0_g1_i1.p1  ORF type:complete len:206 (-),score=29.83 TRINITY_DN1673_c0_g1_i1:192-809(-)